MFLFSSHDSGNLGYTLFHLLQTEEQNGLPLTKLLPWSRHADFCWKSKNKVDKLPKLQDQASFIELWVTSYSVSQLCFKNTVTIQILDIIKRGKDLLLVFIENQTTIFCLFNQLSQGKNISSWIYKALGFVFFS